MSRRAQTQKSAEQPKVLAAETRGSGRELSESSALVDESLSRGELGARLQRELQALSKKADRPSDTKNEVDLIVLAASILGVDRVVEWMLTKVPSLENQTPYSLMSSKDGRRQVERALLKIEHGVY